MPNTIDYAEFLRKAEIYYETAVAQPAAYEQATTELITVVEKLNEIDKSTKTADEKKEDLAKADAPKAIETAKNRASQVMKTAQGSLKGLTELENDLRDQLALDPKNQDLSTKTPNGKISIDYKNIDTAINRTNLPPEAKDTLKNAAKLIKEGKATALKIADPTLSKDSVEKFKKAVEGVESKTEEVSVAIARAKQSEVFQAENAAKRAEDARIAQEKKETQAAKEQAEKPFKELKAELLKEIEDRKSKGSMDAITKIAEKAGLTGADLEEVQKAAKAKTEKRSFFGKIADAIKGNSSDRKETEISAKSPIAEALSKMPKAGSKATDAPAAKATPKGLDPKLVESVKSMQTGMTGKANAALGTNTTAKAAGHAQSKGQGR